MRPCERFPAGAQPGAGRFAVPSSRQSFRTRARARRSRRVGPRPGLRAAQLPSPQPAPRYPCLVFHTASPEAANVPRRRRVCDDLPVGGGCRRALTRMHRRKGWRQTQVQGLTWALRRRLVEAAGHRLIDVRNPAILAVAYDAMLRRSELVALQVVDVTIEWGGSAWLLVHRAKTDPEGGGAMLYLHHD